MGPNTRGGQFCLPIMLLGGVGVCMGERGKGHNTKYMAFFPALKAMCGAEKRNEVGGKNLFLNYRAPLHSLPLFPQEAPSPAHCFQLERGAGKKGEFQLNGETDVETPGKEKQVVLKIISSRTLYVFFCCNQCRTKGPQIIHHQIEK